MASPPSQLEQERYYYGLPSGPKLVVRSSRSDWLQTDGWPIPKMLRPVGNHKIVGLWNDSTGPLRRNILAAVASLEWTALDILRIGYDPKFANEGIEYLVTLFVSVKKDSTSWHVGQSIVQRCRLILQYYDIDDVHVEMKESSITLLMPDPPASPAPGPPAASTASVSTSASAAPIIPKLTAAALDSPMELNSMFSEYLGTCIASSDTAAEGTKCLYLRVRTSDKILALTCRHVALPRQDYDSKYRHDETTPGQAISQPGGRYFAKVKDDIEYALSDLNKKLARLESNESLLDEDKSLRINREKRQRDIQLQNQRALETLNDPAIRIIGHVLFAPAFGIGATQRGSQRLRDWALIDLHQDKHNTNLDRLQNRAMITRWVEEDLRNTVRAEFGESVGHELEIDGSQTVRLTGTITEEEIYTTRLQRESQSLDAKAIMVLKYGRKTGLTVGLANQVKSVLRFPREDDPNGQLSEEWCIVGSKKSRWNPDCTFSEPGDSGACVWDIRGRIGGMITSGLGHELRKTLDVTYATPIEWLMEDIRSHGFDVELVLSRPWELV